tara:strand:- start:269 stop:466 length:198 start_codon:yes stop_codon:yes gene_type:complete
MNDLKVLEYLHKQILESSKDNVDFLADGGAKSFDEYRHVCGVIRGLTQADTLINDLVQRLERDDN